MYCNLFHIIRNLDIRKIFIVVAGFWLVGLAPKCRLIAFIDAASGEVCWARFSLTESRQAYFEVLLRHVQTHCLPSALFSDRHSIFNKHDPEDPIPSQFERALLPLCIGPIQAYSPPKQGKCRAAVSDAARPVDQSYALARDQLDAIGQ